MRPRFQDYILKSFVLWAQRYQLKDIQFFIRRTKWTETFLIKKNQWCGFNFWSRGSFPQCEWVDDGFIVFIIPANSYRIVWVVCWISLYPDLAFFERLLTTIAMCLIAKINAFKSKPDFERLDERWIKKRKSKCKRKSNFALHYFWILRKVK